MFFDLGSWWILLVDISLALVVSRLRHEPGHSCTVDTASSI